MERHKKFFASKKRVTAFKKYFQQDWKEEDFISGMFAVLTASQAPDDREIVKNLLMNSLSEEENTIWEDVLRYSLDGYFWETASRNFGYHTEHPTLKKFFLSFLITHIDRNTGLELGTLESYINKKRQSNECEIFISGWMDNINDSPRFDEYCRNI
ncbi:MAG: BREX-1 system phosphatase PglZ type A, partial [Candidatus Cloacimonetes bacterium]|nr:BREX-1 system phosphatase PglZ type A [Candidatus Cloacimonadota bacterium]